MAENAENSSFANRLRGWGGQGIRGFVAAPQVLFDLATLKDSRLRNLMLSASDAGGSPVAILAEVAVKSGENFRELAGIVGAPFLEVPKKLFHLAGHQVNVSVGAATRTVKWANSVWPLRALSLEGEQAEKVKPLSDHKAKLERSTKSVGKTKTAAKQTPRHFKTEALEAAAKAEPKQVKTAKRKAAVAAHKAPPKGEVDLSKSPREIAAQVTAQAVAAAKTATT